jgi:predicted alpha/beta-hydrolase family hydrolase
VEIDTPHGLARVRLRPAERPAGALVLGHGAGGGIDAPDLTTATAVALECDVSVALVEQPYRVAGRRSPAPAHQLDVAWTAVVDHLRGDAFAGLPLIAGGRSSGARVACRTAQQTGAAGVLCLAFPLHAPGRKPDAERRTRLPELEAVRVPVLVVQGANDPFGMPPAGPSREVAVVAGNHSLRGDREAVAAAIRGWLRGRLTAARRS